MTTFGTVPVGATFTFPSYPATTMTKTSATTFTDPAGREWFGHGPAAVKS